MLFNLFITVSFINLEAIVNFWFIQKMTNEHKTSSLCNTCQNIVN